MGFWVSMCNDNEKSEKGHRLRTYTLTLVFSSKRAAGPLRQATGPPRSGAGMGVGMLRDAGDSLS